MPSVAGFLDHEFGQVEDRLIVNVVGEDNMALTSSGARDSLQKTIFGRLDRVFRIIQVVFGVDVRMDDVIPQGSQQRLALGRLRAFEIRRPEISRNPAKKVPKGHLVENNFRLLYRAVDLVEITMRPCVACDVMSRRVHALHDCWPCGAFVINWPLGLVVAGDEKCGLDLVQVEDIQNV